jgi:hypothetical protein
LNGCCLRAVNQIEDRFHLVCGFAEDEGARDVRRVALDRAAVVEHEDGAFAKGLLPARAVRQRGELVDIEAGFAFESDALVGRGNQRMNIGVVMPGWSDCATAR